MPAEGFVQELQEQIGREFGASQQYVAAAVYYDDSTLPRLASFFYDQALEERGHAMMMVRYLLDSDVRPTIPGVQAPTTEFADLVTPIRIARDEEVKVTGQIERLASIAREEGDFVSEQFMHWFLKEQVEEVATMNDLLDVAERCRERPDDLEQFIAREDFGAEQEDPTAPPVAGG